MLKFVYTSSLRIGYFEEGPPDGQVVVLLHGWPDDARSWDRIVPTLNEAGFKTFAPYLRACGPTTFRSDSEPRSGQLSALGSDVMAFTDALGLQRYALVGHDWGARAAYIAAAERPAHVSHLTALSVGYGTNAAVQMLSLKQTRNYWYHWLFCLPRGADLVSSQRRALCEFLWRTWSPSWNFPAAEFDQTAASFENPDWADVTVHSYRHRWGAASGDARYDELETRLATTPSIGVPTLVLHGSEDACNDPDTSAGKDAFFTARYERLLVDGAGHFPQRESPAVVATAIAQRLVEIP